MQTMQAVLEFLTLSRFGLFLNLAGTIMIAFAVGKNLADAHQLDKKGRKVHLASFLHPKLFTCGLVVIILGFVLQLMA